MSSEYELGKDIQDLKQRLERIEQRLEACGCNSSLGDGHDAGEIELVGVSAIELPESHEAAQSDYKWIIFRASIRRQCRREPPLNKAYSWFWVNCWSHLGKERDDPDGPPFQCRRIDLSYNHGSKVGIDTAAIGHHAAHIRHCHGATLTGRFRAFEGSEEKVVQTSV